MQVQLQAVAPYAEQIAASPEGRRRATEFITVTYEHIPGDLVAHEISGAANCTAAMPLIDYAMREGYDLEADRIDCPVPIVWGTEDKLLRYPSAAVRFRTDWLPTADWIELDGVGHCPQLDVPLETAQLILGFTTR